MIRLDEFTGGDGPQLPATDIPLDQVWPGPGAIEALRASRAGVVRHRADLSGQPGKRDGSGTPDVSIFQANGWCLKTSERRRFDHRDEALESMHELGANKRRLGKWMPPFTALAISQDGQGAWRLWTICPWLTTLRFGMSDAEARGDEAALGASLGTFAEMAGGALRLAVEERIVVDLHPSNFGRGGSACYYLDDDVAQGDRLPAIGYSLLQRVDEYAAMEVAIEQYLDQIERALCGFTWQERAGLDLVPAIEQTLVRTAAGRLARARLVRSLSRGG